ncbi:hypothetical protein IKG13_02450 [Candidatus Saccharibacteria bacterium]|nr:hypothetical protein [Candidatus Saccharibacteria bacterium]MBR3378162.1 hypothetical protein [Candidatus Saccharibacteria bacterium]
MKKMKTKKFAISRIKKVASIILVSSLVFSLVGCGEDSESDAKMTTEDFGTEAEVDGVQEPNQEIDDGALLPETTTEVETTEATTEEETTEQPTVDNGSYKYTIYDGIEVSLPFNIDDYIDTANDGTLCLEVYYMATGCGWTSINDSDTYFYYDCGDYYMYFKHDEHWEEECVEFPTASETYHVYQMKSFHYWFSPPSEPGELYYDRQSSNTEYSSAFVNLKMHHDKLQMVYAGSHPNSALSRDDAILLAYVLSFAKNYPGKNPLYYLDLTNGGVEIGHAGEQTEYTFP